MRNHRLGGAIAALLATASLASAATVINAAPFTISSSGSYIVTSNLAVSTGSAIRITAPNVTLDLGGYTVSSTVDTGIYLVRTKNVRVLNGQVNGGKIGISTYTGSIVAALDSNDVFENLTITGGNAGIILTGAGHTLRYSSIRVINSYAIWLSSNSSLVDHVTVTGDANSNNNQGVSFFGTRNVVRDSHFSGLYYLMYLNLVSAPNLFLGNTIVNTTNAYGGSGTLPGIFNNEFISVGNTYTVNGTTTNTPGYSTNNWF